MEQVKAAPGMVDALRASVSGVEMGSLPPALAHALSLLFEAYPAREQQQQAAEGGAGVASAPPAQQQAAAAEPGGKAKKATGKPPKLPAKPITAFFKPS